MKCFTVSEQEIHDRIPVINGGIGIDGKLAIIADGITFPKPDMGFIEETKAVHPHAPARTQVIMNADYYQYENSNRDKNGSIPIIYNDKRDGSGWALVVWIVKKRGPNYYSNIWALHEALPIIGPQLCYGYVQYLFIMANGGSDIMVKPKNLCLNLHYAYGTLKIDKV